MAINVVYNPISSIAALAAMGGDAAYNARKQQQDQQTALDAANQNSMNRRFDISTAMQHQQLQAQMQQQQDQQAQQQAHDDARLALSRDQFSATQKNENDKLDLAKQAQTFKEANPAVDSEQRLQSEFALRNATGAVADIDQQIKQKMDKVLGQPLEGEEANVSNLLKQRQAAQSQLDALRQTVTAPVSSGGSRSAPSQPQAVPVKPADAPMFDFNNITPESLASLMGGGASPAAAPAQAGGGQISITPVQRPPLQQSGMAAVQGNGPVLVNTPQEAAQLPPGTVFVTPDGQVRTRH